MSGPFLSGPHGPTAPAGAQQGAPAAQAHAANATLSHPPTEIRNLPIGTQLQGVVVGGKPAAAGQPHLLVVRTSEGVLDLRTALQLPVGARVMVSVQSVGDQMLMQLLTPRAGAGAGGAAAAAGGAFAPAHGGLSAGMETIVTVLRPGTATAATATFQSGAGGVPTPGAAPAGGAPTPAVAHAAAALAADGAEAGPPLPPGSRFSAQILAIRAPGEPTPPLQPGTLSGIMIGRTAAGQPMVQTAQGLFALDTMSDAPAGAQLLLRLGAARPSAGAPIQMGPPPSVFAALAHAFPELGEMMQALAATDPAAAAALAARTPQPGARMTTNLLFFMVALRMGDPTRWLGQSAKDVESAGRGDLLRSLGDKFTDSSRMADAPRGQWQLYPTPFLSDQRLDQMMLYVRDHGGGRGDEPDAGGGSRFILEFELTKLGPFQLDGLVKGKRFDLMVRSRLAASPALQAEAVRLFEEANAITGFAGRIAFQTVDKFPVKPLDEIAGERPGLTV